MRRGKLNPPGFSEASGGFGREEGSGKREVKPLIATIGEPSGIGPDLILSSWVRREEFETPSFFVAGDPDLLERRAKLLSIEAPVAEFGKAGFEEAIPVLPLSAPMKGEPGKPSEDDSALVIESIREGVRLVTEGKASALATAPISKHILSRSGFEHPGHTEFLASLAEEATGRKPFPVMMICSAHLRTIPVTIHVPLSRAASLLSEERIAQTCRVAHRELRRRFLIERPRLAVCGLNPHAGEDGLLGDEEETLIKPALERLRKEGIDVRGPFPADSLFHAQARRNYDAAICMYHDQALIPAKTLAFHESVNVTLGLPFIRVSPDHGTAFDLAGTGQADPSSWIAALRMASALAAREADEKP